MLLAAAPPASAAVTHTYTGRFPSGSQKPGALAVDSSGDVYVVNSPAGDILKFDPEGNPVDFSALHANVLDGKSSPEELVPTHGSGFRVDGLAVDASAGPTAGEIYVASREPTFGQSAVYVFSAAGRYLGKLPFEFGSPVSVAVNSSGTVVVENNFSVGPGGEIVEFIPHSADPAEDTVGRSLPFAGQTTNIAIDSTATVYECECQALAVDPDTNDRYIFGGGISEYKGQERLGPPFAVSGEPNAMGNSNGIAVSDTDNTIFADEPNTGEIFKFELSPTIIPDATTGPTSEPGHTTGTLTGHTSAAGGPEITSCYFEYGTTTAYGHTAECEPAAHFFGESEVTAKLTGLAQEATYHYRLVAVNANRKVFGQDRTYTPHAVVAISTAKPTQIASTTAELNGSFLGDGEETHYYFEWGTTTAYGNKTEPIQSAGSPPADQPANEGIAISGLNSATTYHYRFVAENGLGTSYGEDETLTTLPAAPLISGESAAAVSSDSAILQAQVNPGGGATGYHFEYATEAEYDEAGHTYPNATSSGKLPAVRAFKPVSAQLANLTANAVYHYRVVATNADSPQGGTPGPDQTFSTPPFVAVEDRCPNAHVRQQTAAALLPDCRAYELVSAANAGGYDVESNLVPGQTPYGGYPDAKGRVLYGVHDGGIPGTDHPTNRGVDPYLATRTNEGWSTEYVGIPANATPSTEPFASTLLQADAGLDTFAFGGPGICSPCFADGSTGEPLRLPGGRLIQGMAGSEEPGPGAQPAGYVAKPLSADGIHFVFGSKAKFQPGAEPGQVSIYDRDLKTGETHLVSKLPAGGNIPCLAPNCASESTVAELAISSDGSHILLGQLTEEQGAVKHWHLFMSVGDSGGTIELTPGAAKGVLFDGMSADGEKVFFSSEEHLTGEDEAHTGADIYMWEAATDSLTLISRGDGGSCDPVANSAREHWNVIGTAENCGAVAIGGGGGVSSANGTVYFLSPEQLTGSEHGVPGAPNLYRAGPADGYATHYVTTLESALNAPHPPRLRRTFAHNFETPEASFTDATGIAVDHSSGDFYVIDVRSATVEKFDPSGHLITSFGDTENETTHKPEPNGELRGKKTPAETFSELYFGFLPFSTQLAVDQTNGDLYVPDLNHGVVDKFSSSGKYLGQIEVGNPIGVAVDPANGDVYIGSLSGVVQVFDSTGQPVYSIATENGGPAASVAVDPNGNIYVTEREGETYVYKPSNTSPLEYANGGERFDPNPSQSVAVDPSTGDVYVDEGGQIARYGSSGNLIETLGTEGGVEHLVGSVGAAIDPEGNLYATNAAGTALALFSPSLAPDPRVDNPAVLDSVTEPEARHTADFQLTPDGNDTVFGSTLSLTGYENSGHPEVFRYDAPTEKLTCVSCSPSNSEATGDASLASDGLSLTDDGRVFFTTPDALAPGDTDNRKDVYEWEPSGTGNCQSTSSSFLKAQDACLALISAGTSTFDSGLLGVSADGTDAYFFTRDSLAPQDKNGPTMKIYDARALGGFPYLYPEVTCKASDECHGPASPTPGPIQAGSEAGSPGNSPEEPKPRTCKHGLVLKHGKCVKPHHHKHHKRANHKRGGKK